MFQKNLTSWKSFRFHNIFIESWAPHNKFIWSTFHYISLFILDKEEILAYPHLWWDVSPGRRLGHKQAIRF
jgi:hypothetical protein